MTEHELADAAMEVLRDYLAADYGNDTEGALESMGWLMDFTYRTGPGDPAAVPRAVGLTMAAARMATQALPQPELDECLRRWILERNRGQGGVGSEVDLVEHQHVAAITAILAAQDRWLDAHRVLGGYARHNGPAEISNVLATLAEIHTTAHRQRP